MENYAPLIKGCFTGAGLIVAIGAQNAFVLKQGLMKNQVFVTALFCAVTDALLVMIGVAGFGKIFSSSDTLIFVSKWGGAVFLFWYGFRSFRSVFHKQSLLVEKIKGPPRPSLKETFAILAMLTFLNPHVYLDTIILIGSMGAQFYPHERPWFAVGVIISSFLWFFGICYGARLLAPFFENPKSWKVLDFLVGCTMWAIAISLLFFTSFERPCLTS